MPTYEYECTKCKLRFERFQSISAEPIRDCPACSGEVRRLIGSGAGIIFKGSGFFQTDYRSDNYKKRAKEEQGASSSPCSSCTAKDSCEGKKSNN